MQRLSFALDSVENFPEGFSETHPLLALANHPVPLPAGVLPPPHLAKTRKVAINKALSLQMRKELGQCFKQTQQQRQAIIASGATKSWRAWLSVQAKAGNEIASQILGRSTNQPQIVDNLAAKSRQLLSSNTTAALDFQKTLDHLRSSIPPEKSAPSRGLER